MRFLREALGKSRIVGVYDGNQMNLKLKIICLIATDANRGLHIRCGQFQPAHTDHVLQRAAKASGISRRKELLGIDAILLSSTKTCGQRHFKIDRAIFHTDMTIASAG